MATTSEKTPGWEEQILAYERSRRRKHPPDHLNSVEVLVLRRVVDNGSVEEHRLRSEIGRTSLSRAISALAKRNLLTRTIDQRDGRKHLLLPTAHGNKLLEKLEQEHNARKRDGLTEPAIGEADKCLSHRSP